ncbi:MAG: DNA polymerase III subunit delta' [Halothiobacillaceae bacterium]|jgi:DNA polymerase-3 subunit delta'|nr:DNA polymerase III subunit delta' [Halothiobacillaceae bacterium]MDY0050406.1 DNA polymerase III subunit delta' [Halothiobacillaceae bacterium]
MARRKDSEESALAPLETFLGEPADPLPWQATSWAALASRRRQGRLPHALLLAGDEGLGQMRFARRLVASLLCRQPGGDFEACGQCAACRQFAAGAHPDFVLLAPEEPGKAIRIDPLRSFCTDLTLTGSEGGPKIGLIAPADALNAAAANALLKTLEEPPGDALILLVTHRPALLPVTVLSRCQRLSFTAPTRDEALSWLREQLPAGADAAPLARWLTLANGAPLRALTLIEQADTLGEGFWSALTALVAGRGDVTRLAREMAKLEPRAVLQSMQYWFADLFRARLGLPPMALRIDATLAAALDLQALVAYHQELVRAAALAQHPLNRELFFEGLFAGLGRLDRSATLRLE